MPKSPAPSRDGKRTVSGLSEASSYGRYRCALMPVRLAPGQRLILAEVAVRRLIGKRPILIGSCRSSLPSWRPGCRRWKPHFCRRSFCRSLISPWRGFLVSEPLGCDTNRPPQLFQGSSQNLFPSRAKRGSRCSNHSARSSPRWRSAGWRS